MQLHELVRSYFGYKVKYAWATRSQVDTAARSGSLDHVNLTIAMEPIRKKRKLWDVTNMTQAIKVVQNKEMNVSQAAREYSVPRKSLENRIKAKVVHGTLPGPQRVLDDEEEGALVEYIKYMAKGGFPMTRKIICAYAWAIAKQNGHDSRFNQEHGPGKHWWSDFRHRHEKDLSLRRADKLDRGRARNANKEVIGDYFNLLEKTLVDNGIKDKCDRIYNCDESGMQLDSTNDLVLAPRGSKHVYSQAMGTREHITVHICVCADGKVMPPMIIFAKGFPGGRYTEGGPNKALYAKSESGYMDGELYLLWFKKIFLRECSWVRPVLLIQDGHKSHITTDLIDLACQEKVILFNLPPHTTHVAQPLDKSIFKPLKAAFSTSLKSLTFAQQDFVVAKRDFPQLFCDPFDQTCSPFRIKQSFRDAGICPFDPAKVDLDRLNPSEHFTTSTPTCKGSSGETSPEESDSSASVTGTQVPKEGAGAREDNTSSDGCHDNNGFNNNSITPPSSVAIPQPPTPSTTTTTPLVNPLVSAGLIPKRLEDLLQVPQRKLGGQRTRVVTKARVITSDEYMEELKKKENEAKEKEEAKQRRKEEREKKKREKEEERVQKMKKREEDKERKSKKKEQTTKISTKTNRKAEESVPSSTSTQSASASAVTSSDSMASASTSGGRSTGRVRIPSMKAVDTYELSSSSSDEEDDACFLCGKMEPPGVVLKQVDWIACRSCERWYHEHCIGRHVDEQFICHLCEE